MLDSHMCFLTNVVYVPVVDAADVPLTKLSIAPNLIETYSLRLDTLCSEGVRRASRGIHTFFAFFTLLLP